jgi:hypothetical protein
MKQHLSEPRPGAVSVMERRAHADRCKSLPEHLPEDVDLMIEVCLFFPLYRRNLVIFFYLPSACAIYSNKHG